MLGLDTSEGRVKQADTFQRVAEEMGAVGDVGVGEASMVVLTVSGDLWVLGGGESRQPNRLSLSTPGRPVEVAAGLACVLVALEGGQVVVVGPGVKEQAMQWSLARRVGRVARLVARGATAVALLEMAS